MTVCSTSSRPSAQNLEPVDCMLLGGERRFKSRLGEKKMPPCIQEQSTMRDAGCRHVSPPRLAAASRIWARSDTSKAQKAELILRPANIWLAVTLIHPSYSWSLFTSSSCHSLILNYPLRTLKMLRALTLRVFLALLLLSEVLAATYYSVLGGKFQLGATSTKTNVRQCC